MAIAMEPMNSHVGYLYQNAVSKQHPNRPHISGTVTLPIDLLRHLVAAHSDRKDISIRLAGWERAADNGRVYYKMVASPTWKETLRVAATIDELFW